MINITITASQHICMSMIFGCIYAISIAINYVTVSGRFSYAKLVVTTRNLNNALFRHYVVLPAAYSDEHNAIAVFFF